MGNYFRSQNYYNYLLTPINIFDPDNIILSSIAPDLNLNEFQRNSARVGETVHTADWKVDRFVFVDENEAVV